jgi:uncharacterized protein
MEDILASIRRILNEDESPAASAPPGEPAEEPAEEDVLVLDQSMMVRGAEPAPDPADAASQPEPAPRPQPEIEVVMPPPQIESPREIVAAEPPQQAQAGEHPPEQAPLRDPAASFAELVGAEAAAAAALSVGSLVRTLSAGRATQVYSGGPTLEDLVRAELRPLLKEWLDTYLPPMVERLVRAEIERVVGRAVL